MGPARVLGLMYTKAAMQGVHKHYLGRSWIVQWLGQAVVRENCRSSLIVHKIGGNGFHARMALACFALYVPSIVAE